MDFRSIFLGIVSIFAILSSSVHGQQQWNNRNNNAGQYPSSQNTFPPYNSRPAVNGPSSNLPRNFGPPSNPPGSLNNNPSGNSGLYSNQPDNSRFVYHPGNSGNLGNSPGNSAFRRPAGNYGNLGNSPGNYGPVQNPAGNSRNFDNPPGNSRNFGNPAGNSRNYGNPPENYRNYGNPPENYRNYGNPPENNRNFGNPPRNYGNHPGTPNTFGNHPGGPNTFGHQPGSPNTFYNQPGGPNTFGYQPGSSNNFGNQPGGPNTFGHRPGSPYIFGNPPVSQPPPSTIPAESFSNQTQSSASSTAKPKDSDSSRSSVPSNHSSIQIKAHKGPNLFSHEGDPLKGCRIVCIFNSKHFFRKDAFTPGMIDPDLCTHINYEFAKLDPKSYEMIVADPDLDLERNFFQEAIDLKKWNDKLKILLSLGGWFDSTKKYSEMADDPKKRKNFVEKAVDFLVKHGFDGMDVAWEYPNCWQGAIGINPKDKDNFTLLLQELKDAFKKYNFTLSVSVSAIKREVIAAYDVPAISKIVDFINVMTYDMHGPWENMTGHHMQFDKRPEDKDPDCNVKAAMNFWAQEGAEKKKLNMGMAFYGKTFTLADSNKHGMGDPTIGIGDPGPISDQGGFLLFSEICLLLNTGNWTEARDPQAGVYAYSGDQWACYDNPMMVVMKIKFLISQGFGGVLLKDYSGDDYKGICFKMTNPLVKMIFLKIKQLVNWKGHKGRGYRKG